jgi:hypothetical protein
MATVLELARFSGVSTETVLRVILREPVSGASQLKVANAIAVLGMPDYPRPDGHVEVLPAQDRAAGTELEPADDPAAPIVAELRSLFREVVEGMERERRERIDDVALTSDLIVEGWRNVDRRLGRLEKIVERLSREQYFGDANGNGHSNGNGARRIHLP